MAKACRKLISARARSESEFREKAQLLAMNPDWMLPEPNGWYGVVVAGAFGSAVSGFSAKNSRPFSIFPSRLIETLLFALLAFESSDVTPRRQVRLHGGFPSAATRFTREQLEELAPGLVTAAAPGQSYCGRERQRLRETGRQEAASKPGKGRACCRTAPQ